MFLRRRWIFSVLIDAAAGRHCIAKVEVLSTDDLNAGKVLSDGFAELGVVGRERVWVGFDEMARGVEGRRCPWSVLGRRGCREGRADSRVQAESLAVWWRAGQLHWMRLVAGRLCYSGQG